MFDHAARPGNRSGNDIATISGCRRSDYQDYVCATTYELVQCRRDGLLVMINGHGGHEFATKCLNALSDYAFGFYDYLLR